MAGQIAAVEVEECNRNWTVAALKERTKEREAHFELAALEIFDELDAFVTAGRVHRAPRKRVEEPFEQLPKYGLACDEKAERSLDEIMKSIDEWGLDVHSISQHSRGHPLTVVAYTIFKQRDLFKFLGISALTFLNCMLDLEAKYNSEPTYHNAVHAADVVHTVHVILNGTALRRQCAFSDLEVVAALFAAAIHDVGHPGLMNLYFRNKGDELADLYNDAACLENLSLSIAFETLRHSNLNIFAELNQKQRASIRKIVIDMVLATDMSRHASLQVELDELLKLKRASKNSFQLPKSYTSRIRVLQCVLHCADLSNPSKPLNMYKVWASSVLEEFFRQGDREKREGVTVSMMCDRDTVVMEKTQVEFITRVVVPLYQRWAEFVRPDADDILAQVKANNQWYAEELARKTAAVESAGIKRSTRL